MRTFESAEKVAGSSKTLALVEQRRLGRLCLCRFETDRSLWCTVQVLQVVV